MFVRFKTFVYFLVRLELIQVEHLAMAALWTSQMLDQLEKFNKHSSLFFHSICDNEKSFIMFIPNVNPIKLFLLLSLLLGRISQSVCPFSNIRIFLSKAGAYPSRAPSNGSFVDFPH